MPTRSCPSVPFPMDRDTADDEDDDDEDEDDVSERVPPVLSSTSARTMRILARLLSRLFNLEYMSSTTLHTDSTDPVRI